METLSPKKIIPPPRAVPLTTHIQVLFGGLTNQIGWPILSLGIILFWVFTRHSELMEIGKFQKPLEEATGRVNSVRETGAIVNGQAIEEYFYSFWTAEGLFKGSSFGRGRQYRVGSRVEIEYIANKPGTSRIRGLKTEEYGLAIGIIPLFIPLLGLIMVLLGIFSGYKTLYLLTKGEMAHGELVEKRMTNRMVQEQPIYELNFRFRAANGKKYNVQTFTHETHVLEDEEEELVLYQASNPRFALMLDSMAGNPEVTEEGLIKGKPLSAAFVNLVIPGAAIIGNAIYLLILLT